MRDPRRFFVTYEVLKGSKYFQKMMELLFYSIFFPTLELLWFTYQVDPEEKNNPILKIESTLLVDPTPDKLPLQGKIIITLELERFLQLEVYCDYEPLEKVTTLRFKLNGVVYENFNRMVGDMLDPEYAKKWFPNGYEASRININTN